MTTSNLPVLQPRVFLGIKTNIKGNAHFLTDEDIIYPVGAVLAIHNIIQKRQKFLKLPERGRNVTSISISPNKKFIVVAESGVKPTVTLYDSTTLKKKKQFSVPSDKENTSKEFAAVSFTVDTRLILIVTGDPDWMMYVFKMEKNKLESFTRANNSNGTGTIKQLSCNPNDVNVIALVGDGVIRMLANNDMVWRQFGYGKGDQWNLTSAIWLSQDRLLAGSSDGRLLFIESGELKTVFNANDLPVLNLKIKEELPQTSQTSLKVSSVTNIITTGQEDIQIRCLTGFPRGFAFGYLSGTVHVYEMESPQKYTKKGVYKIPDHTIIREYEVIEDKDKLTTINQIAVNPTQDRILISCRESQLYWINLWSHDITANPEVLLTECGLPLHNGPIGSMAVCSWKPILMTSGANDRMLKIWNYEEEDIELSQKFEDDLFDIALHPTGNYAIVGFSDKLRFLTVTLDEFVVTREFPIRTCRKCSFSKLGYLFAGANGNVIQVYSAISFELLYVLKGHNGRILDMSWSKEDKKMSSCGNDGAVYEWMVSHSKRSAEVILKQITFTGCAITSDGKATYSVSNDGHIRELMASNIHRDVVVNENGLDSLILSQIDQILIVSGNSGSVYNIKLPILEKADYVEYIMHAAPVTKMLMSYDDRYLMTGGEDGSICIWKLLNIEGKAIKMDKDFKPTKDVLISKQELDEKLSSINDLQLRLREMETEFSYQLRQNDVINSLRMKDIHSGYCSAIEELKEKNEQLEADHTQEIGLINQDIMKMKEDHDEFVRELEANYNEKLIFEYEKYLRLEEKMEKMRRNYEKELDDLRQEKVNSEQDITSDFLEQLRQKQLDIDELTDKANQQTAYHECIKQQIEDDADREIYDLKTRYAKELKEEQDLNVKIRGEAATIKKKAFAYQKDVEKLKHKVGIYEVEHEKQKRNIVDLDKEISDFKKEIAERDSTIQDKEKRIYDLKHKNQELEKFKFILEFKIKELKTQIEPREKTIQEQTLQINEMVKELENLQKVIIHMDVQLLELRNKLHASDLEVKREMAKNVELKKSLKKIKIEIYHASRFIQDVPNLIRAVRNMYHKFDTDKEFEMLQAEDSEIKSEFTRQREFLERTVTTLKQRIDKGDHGGRDRVKLVEENSALLMENNSLRRNLKIELTHNQRLNALVGLSHNVLPKVAQEKIKKATTTREEIHEQYRNTIEENERTINALQEDNNRLLAEMIDINSPDDYQDDDNNDDDDDNSSK